MSIVSQPNTIRILSGYNQWWQLRSVQKMFIKPTHRTAYKEVLRLLSDDRIRVIYLAGPHRTGKTAMIHQIIQNLIDTGTDPKQILYLNFSHPFFNFLPMESFYSVYRDNICPNLNARTYCFFDDTQLAPDWEKNVRALADQYKEVTIVVGSAIRPGSIHENEAFLHIPPISYYEHCQIATGSEHIEIDQNLIQNGVMGASTQDLREISKHVSLFRPQFMRYLYTGGFLNLIGETDDIRIQRMIQKSVVCDTLLRDLNVCFNVRTGIELEKIFLYLCFKCPDVISYEALMRDVDCSTRPTIEKYVNYLTEACLIYQCFPQESNGEHFQKVQPKIYLADSAIHNSMLMLNDVRISEAGMNSIVETVVHRHLRFYGPDNEEGHITYNRAKSSGKNIDMILDGRKRIFIDVRYDDDIRLSRKDTIITKCGDADLCLLITKNDRMIGYSPDLPKNIFCLPASVFLFLIGQAKSTGLSFLDNL